MTAQRGGRGRSRAPSPIGAILQESPALAPSKDRVDRESWRRLVGERVAGRTRPGRLKDGTLTVYVASSVWAQELSLLTGMVRERLQAAGFNVKDLVFRVGDTEPAVPLERSAPLPAPARAALPPDLKSRIDRIEDAALRAAIEEAAAYSLGRVQISASPPGTRAPRAGARGNVPPDPAGPRSRGAPRDTRGRR